MSAPSSLVVDWRSSSDRGPLAEEGRGLCLLFRRLFDLQKGRALCEAAYLLLLYDPLALALCHPYLDPILALLYDFRNICPLFLWHDSRDWKNKYLPQSPVERTDDEAIVISFARPGLDLGLCLVRDRGGGHHDLLWTPE